MSEVASREGRGTRAWIGIVLGPLVFVGILSLPLPADLLSLAESDAQISARDAWIVLALLAFMAIWWVTEAIPIPSTALLPLVVLPLGNVAGVGAVAGEYLHPVVVLLLGGFILARSIERWGLHERIALNVLARAGEKPASLIGGFMSAAAGLSMWISNTATAIMMVPIALSVAAVVVADRRGGGDFIKALLLGIAYACSIGGLGTYIGTPTNLLVKDAVEGSTGQAISFTDWMMLGIPAVVLLVPLAWLVLTRIAFRIGPMGTSGAQEVIASRLSALGAITPPERRVIGVFVLVAGLWILGRPLSEIVILDMRPLSGLTDQVAALLGVILCFLIPAGAEKGSGETLLDWRTAESIPWGVILLFGGGMALAAFIRSTGLGAWIGSELALFAALPIIALIIIVTASVIFMTEVTSNVATAAAVMPVLVALAENTGLDVVMLGAPVAFAASCAFMLPMATGPNAVVHATDRIALPTMARAGFVLNLISIPVIVLLAYFLAPAVF